MTYLMGASPGALTPEQRRAHAAAWRGPSEQDVAAAAQALGLCERALAAQVCGACGAVC